MSDGPWHCGACGRPLAECLCGDALMMIIRIPGLTADIDEHNLAARSMVDMINAQRHENWVCGGGDPDQQSDVRLVTSLWLNATESDEELPDATWSNKTAYGQRRPGGRRNEWQRGRRDDDTRSPVHDGREGRARGHVQADVAHPGRLERSSRHGRQRRQADDGGAVAVHRRQARPDQEVR